VSTYVKLKRQGRPTFSVELVVLFELKERPEARERDPLESFLAAQEEACYRNEPRPLALGLCPRRWRPGQRWSRIRMEGDGQARRSMAIVAAWSAPYLSVS
jgi:hypothetical protein